MGGLQGWGAGCPSWARNWEELDLDFAADGLGVLLPMESDCRWFSNAILRSW